MAAKQPPRKRIPSIVETAVLTKSRRRCAICFHLHGDTGTKRGQVAHLDHRRANSIEDNLAYLCFNHHDEYDSKTKQHKNFTIQEVKAARGALHKWVRKGMSVLPSKPSNIPASAKTRAAPTSVAARGPKKHEPLIFPEHWISAQQGSIYSSIIFLNDSKVTAYDISIETIAFDGWEVIFHEIPRIGPHERGESNLYVGGRNSSNDLGWILGLWHKEHMVVGPSGPSVAGLAPLRMNVRYRDKQDSWYLSLCEISRSAGFPGDKIVQLRLAEHKAISKPEISPAVQQKTGRILGPLPTEPILKVCGYGHVMVGTVGQQTIIQTVAVDNVQMMTATIAVNAAIELLYNHPVRGKRRIIPYAWFSKEIAGQQSSVCPGPIDVPSGGRFNAPYIYKHPNYERITFPTEKDGVAPFASRTLDQGLWKVLITVTADNCQPIQCGVAFEVTKDGLLGAQRLISNSGDFNQWLVTYGDQFGD